MGKISRDSRNTLLYSWPLYANIFNPFPWEGRREIMFPYTECSAHGLDGIFSVLPGRNLFSLQFCCLLRWFFDVLGLMPQTYAFIFETSVFLVPNPPEFFLFKMFHYNIQGGAKGGLQLWVCQPELILALLLTCIIFYMNNCKPNCAPPCILNIKNI